MYAFINGTVEEIMPEGVVIEAGGVGYFIQCTSSVTGGVELGQKAKIYTYQHVREDAIVLYGFASKEERTMFLRLISVSGIGPKSAVQVLSAISAKDLALAIASGDCDALCRVQGIGKKTAQRIILELREKVDELSHADTGADDVLFTTRNTNVTDAMYALCALGLTAAEASEAVKSAQGTTTEEIVRNALKCRDRR